MNDVTPPPESETPPFMRSRFRLRDWKIGSWGERAILIGLGCWGGSSAGFVEGAHVAWHELFRSPSGAAAGFLLAPIVFPVDMVCGLLLGALVGAAIALVPGVVLGSAMLSQGRSSRIAIRSCWGFVVFFPTLIIVFSPETIEPLFASVGLISEAPHVPGPPPPSR
jgi:hypothetical protein